MQETAWAVFKQHHTDLIGIGKGSLSLKTLLHQQRNSSARYTACPRLIHATKHESNCFVSVVRKILCHQPQMQQSFTSCVHTIKRNVWNRAHSQYPDLPPVTEMGWMHLDGRLVPRLLSLPPIPKAWRRSPHVVVRRGASANAAATGKFEA